MCYKVACKCCGKATWMGCGLHVDDALHGFKEEELCANWKKGCRYPCGPVIVGALRKVGEATPICSRSMMRKPKTGSNRSLVSTDRSNRSLSNRSLSNRSLSNRSLSNRSLSNRSLSTRSIESDTKCNDDSVTSMESPVGQDFCTPIATASTHNDEQTTPLNA